MRSLDWRQEVRGVRDMESQGNQKQDTKIKGLGVLGVLREPVMGPLRSRAVREKGHRKSHGKRRDSH